MIWMEPWQECCSWVRRTRRVTNSCARGLCRSWIHWILTRIGMKDMKAGIRTEPRPQTMCYHRARERWNRIAKRSQHLESWNHPGRCVSPHTQEVSPHLPPDGFPPAWENYPAWFAATAARRRLAGNLGISWNRSTVVEW